MKESIKIVQEHYNSNVQGEWERIDGRPEFLLTCRMLDRYIKPGDKVLDIGGGPGRYSLYLAEKGCDVTLFDLSSENVKYALMKADEKGLSLKTVNGDAREADKLISGQFDHILLMGPMYHLLEERDRVTTMKASLRLLKPGGIIYVSFINLFAGMIYGMKFAPELIASRQPADVEYLESAAASKSYAGDAFTKAYFIKQDEILPFMSQFPLEKLHLFGQEGITPPCEKNIMSQPDDIIDLWFDFCEKTWEREDLLSWSEHLMYVGRKTEDAEDSDETEPEVRDEIARNKTLPFVFNGFIDIPHLSDGVIQLVCTAKNPANPEKKYAPSYTFAICIGSEKVGEINIRIGYSGFGPDESSLYYGGQIGYNIDEEYRGNGYAGRACRLLLPVAKAHKMEKLFITTAHTNAASVRVCEKLGAKLVRVAKVPKWHDLYTNGHQLVNIYEWIVQ